MITKLIGWSLDEYKQWSEAHQECARTTELRKFTKEEVRLNFDQGSPRIAGYASVFNSWYELFDGFREQVAPGAFTNTIGVDDIRALLNHNPNYVLGRNTSGTLTLREDERGLYYDVIAPDTSFARDLLVSIKRKDITQSSFGFNIVEQTVKYDKNSDEISRTLTEVKLFDVSPVTFPASPKTEVSVRMHAGRSEDGGQVIVIADGDPGSQSNTDYFARLEDLRKRIES